MAQATFDFAANGVAFDLTLTFAGAADSGQAIAISGTVGGAAITGIDNSYEGPDNQFSLSNPYVDYNGISFDTASNAYNVFFDGASGDFIISSADGYNYGIQNVSVHCYTADALISTERGEVRVADLRVGDRVSTLSGDMQPIRWIGQQTVTAAGCTDPTTVLPIRIKPGALGPETPNADLVVSPGHGLYFDGFLVPARHLVNGVTVVREQPRPDRVLAL